MFDEKDDAPKPRVKAQLVIHGIGDEPDKKIQVTFAAVTESIRIPLVKAVRELMRWELRLAVAFITVEFDRQLRRGYAQGERVFAFQLPEGRTAVLIFGCSVNLCLSLGEIDG